MSRVKILFGRNVPIAYINNQKAGCTFVKNFVFRVNAGYEYHRPELIHHSEGALLKRYDPPMSILARMGIGSDDRDTDEVWRRLNPETFTIVRDPLDRLISGFISKIFTESSKNQTYVELREQLTVHHGVDLSRNRQPKVSILQFVKWLETRNLPAADRHFRPQYYNLAADRKFKIGQILRLDRKDDINAFLAKHLPAEDLKEFLTGKYNESHGFAKADFMSDELISKVRRLYKVDYGEYFS